MLVLVEGCVCLLFSIRALQHTFCPLRGIMLCIAGELNRGYAMLCRYAFESLPSGRLSETRDDQDESRGWDWVAGGLARESAIYRSGSGIRRY